MRDLKFRAWDKKGKKMCMVCDLNWVNDNILTHLPDVRTDENDPAYPWRTPGKEIELMQYTGLKDKNGKEIYEGDIVQFKSKHIDRAWNYKVMWTEKLCLGLRALFKNIREAERPIYQSILRADKGEVIGNIYENPELLK